MELGNEWQRDECLKVIDRKIYGCSINTDFGGYRDRDKRYPQCLPIFEKQAQECAAFYESERAKCGVGSADAGAPGDTETQDAAGGCSDINVANHGHDEAPVSCEGPVVDGKAHGDWVLRWADGNTHEGPYVDGKENGHWVIRAPDGLVTEGPFVDGKMHGPWTTIFQDGDCRIFEYFRDVMGDMKPC